VSKSQPVTQVTNSSTSIPDWLTAAARGNIGEANALPGYTPYTGEMVAGLTPNQLQALQAAVVNSGQGQGIIRTAANGGVNALNFTAPNITAPSVNADTQGLLSPFTQDVVDRTNAELQRSADLQKQGNATTATSLGAFGGDRAAIMDAETQRNADTIKANTDANLYSTGFDNAQKGALTIGQANQTADISSALARIYGINALTGAGTAYTGAGATDIAGLLSTGDKSQNTLTAQDQARLGQYQTAYQSLLQRLGLITSAVDNAPHGTTGTSTTTGNVYTNPLGQIAGLGLAGAGLYNSGMFGGISSGLSGLLGSGAAAGGAAAEGGAGAMDAALALLAL
jgi:hypothetical protein